MRPGSSSGAPPTGCGNTRSCTTRAYQLGETGLSEVLIARRMALESELAAMTAQLDAQESRYRLLLDAHRLWPLDPAEGADGHVH